MVNRFYQVTNFTPWLVKYFDSKRSLHPGPGVEGISLSLELTFHSFDPSSAYCWDNSGAKSEAPKHIPPPFECKPCSIPESGESGEPSRFLQGRAFGFCLRISVFHALLFRLGVDALPLWRLLAWFPELTHIWVTFSSSLLPESICAQLEAGFAHGPGQSHHWFSQQYWGNFTGKGAAYWSWGSQFSTLSHKIYKRDVSVPSTFAYPIEAFVACLLL